MLRAHQMVVGRAQRSQAEGSVSFKESFSSFLVGIDLFQEL